MWRISPLLPQALRSCFWDGMTQISSGGKRILIMDDVISTGGSLKAMEALVEKAGGIVTGKIAVLAEGGAADRTDIKFLAKLPVFNADGTVK